MEEYLSIGTIVGLCIWPYLPLISVMLSSAESVRFWPNDFAD